jgi:hypothetical protein
MECFQSENMKARDIEWLKEEKKLAQNIKKNIIGLFLMVSIIKLDHGSKHGPCIPKLLFTYFP